MKKSGSDTHGELMNIKQAAALLNVSEVSLRRWTDSGRLACSRIGRRRERRFRREDLMSFLEGSTPAANADARPQKDQARKAGIELEGMSIDYGNHLCSFYETDLGCLKLSVPYLADGLRKKDLCYLIASDGTRDMILENLRKVTAGVDSAIEDGRLLLGDGAASADEMYDYFEHSFVMTGLSGEQSMRVLGDMAWFLDKGLGIESVIDFETRYNHSLAHRFPVASLCQYDTRRFTGTGIVNALKCHEDTFQFPLGHFLGV
jgi:transcriptional repressor of dcmA and dcmR